MLLQFDNDWSMNSVDSSCTKTLGEDPIIASTIDVHH